MTRVQLMRFATVALGVSWLSSTQASRSIEPEKFVEDLPIPHRIVVGTNDSHEITLTLTKQTVQLHRDVPSVGAFTYDGTVPGPTIEVERGETLTVHWKNELPAMHVLPRPVGADEIEPDVRAITHLHGAVVEMPDPMSKPLNSDGWPDAFTVSGEEQIAVYPNNQAARTLWYHDHAMGTTGRNVAAGLVGLYFIHDDYERSLNLPSGAFDIPLFLQARQLEVDGSMPYTDDISNEFSGNVVAVNGKLWPKLRVEPRKYRFRIVNGSNARSYGLKLVDTVNNSSGPAFYQVGTDAGFLEHAVVINDPANPRSKRLVLAPAERADIVVDFSAYAGRSFLLHNNHRDIGEIEAPIPEVLRIDIAAVVSAPDTSALPRALAPIEHLRVADAVETRKIVFDQMDMGGGRLMLVLNNKHWHDPVEEKPVLGTTEVWELVNTLNDTHPFHIHLVDFQVLDRRVFDVEEYRRTGRLVYLAEPEPPLPNEAGWKDTIQVYPQMVTRIIMRFGPYPGFYVYHCHILEHEDMDMMRPYQIQLP